VIEWLQGVYEVENLTNEKIAGAEAVLLARQAFALEHDLGLDQVQGRRVPDARIACIGYRIKYEGQRDNG
jgi:hypothetical protein